MVIARSVDGERRLTPLEIHCHLLALHQDVHAEEHGGLVYQVEPVKGVQVGERKGNVANGETPDVHFGNLFKLRRGPGAPSH